MDEIYLTVKQVAEILSLSENHVIKVFSGQPGVQDWGSPEDYMKHKRRRRALRIPRSVLEKVMKGKTT